MTALQVLHYKLAKTSLSIKALRDACGSAITVFSVRWIADGNRADDVLTFPNKAIKRRVIKRLSPAHPEWGTYVGLKRQASVLLLSIHVVKYETHQNVETLHHGVRSHRLGSLVDALREAHNIVARLHVQIEKGKTFESLAQWYEKNARQEVKHEEMAVA